MTGPTFLCIGAQKAGTTWLYRGLELRDDVWLPPVKELHFFDEKIRFPDPWFTHLHGPRGPSSRWRRQLRNERRRRSRVPVVDEAEKERRHWCSTYFFGTPSVDWYRSLFAGVTGPSGEITPEYATLDTESIDRAVEAVPGVRAVYLVRNPIEREWSAALMASRGGNRGPESVLRQNRRHVRYLDNIDRWSAALGPGRLYLGFFDDIVAHPEELLTDILGFLGAATMDVSLPRGRPNAGSATTIPGGFAVALAEELGGEISGMADRFGGPATNWARTADWLHRTRPDSEIEYPFRTPGSGTTSARISSLIL